MPREVPKEKARFLPSLSLRGSGDFSVPARRVQGGTRWGCRAERLRVGSGSPWAAGTGDTGESMLGTTAGAVLALSCTPGCRAGLSRWVLHWDLELRCSSTLTLQPGGQQHPSEEPAGSPKTGCHVLQLWHQAGGGWICQLSHPLPALPRTATALKMWQVLIITHPNPLPLPAPALRPPRARSLPLGLHISRWGFLDGVA